MYETEGSDTASDVDSNAGPLWDEDMDPPIEGLEYFDRGSNIDKLFHKVPLITIQTRTFNFPVNEWTPILCPHLEALLAQPPSPIPLTHQKEPISLHHCLVNPGNKTLTITNESPILLLCLIYHCYDYLDMRLGPSPKPYIDTIISWGIETIPQLLSLFDLAIRYSYTDLHRRIHSYLIQDLEDAWNDDRFLLYLLSLWHIQTFQTTHEGVAFRDEVLAIAAQHYDTLKDHEFFTFFIENMPPEVSAYILWAVGGDSDTVEAWYPGQWFSETFLGETRRDTIMRMEFWDQGWDFSAFRDVCWGQPASRPVSTPVEFLEFDGIGGFFADDGEVSPGTLSFPAIPAFSIAVGGRGSGGEEQSGEEVREERSRTNPCSRLRKWCSTICLRRLRSS